MSANQEALARECEFFFSEKVRIAGFTAMLSNCALCLIKPHVVLSGMAGQVVQRILDEGYEISAMQSHYLDRATAEEFLDLYKPLIRDFSLTIDQLVSGPCIALEIR